MNSLQQPHGVLAYLPGEQDAGARTVFHGRTRNLLARTPVSRILHGSGDTSFDT
jgi:hypothetical protein